VTEDKTLDISPEPVDSAAVGASLPLKTPSAERVADSPTTAPCKLCGTSELPDAAGRCPVKTCRAARVGNKIAAVHDGRAKLSSEDLATRDALMARLFRERGGRSALDIVSQLRVEDYATAQIQLGKVTRRLEMLGAVSTEGRKRSSLVDTYNVFSARVERLAAELPAPRESSRTNGENYDAMTEDQLIERTEQMLVRFYEHRDFTRRSNEAVRNAVAAAAVVVLEPSDPGYEEQEATRATAITQPPAAESCPYCKRLLAECNTLRDEKPRIWAVICSSHPDVQKKKDEDATAVMIRTMAHGSGITQW
jgi:hypothetical protein